MKHEFELALREAQYVLNLAMLAWKLSVHRDRDLDEEPELAERLDLGADNIDKIIDQLEGIIQGWHTVHLNVDCEIDED